jgi:hypothetical protein
VLQVTVSAALVVFVLTPFVRVAREKSKIGTSPSITNLGAVKVAGTFFCTAWTLVPMN